MSAFAAPRALARRNPNALLATSVAPRLVARFGTRAVIVLGMLLAAVGLALLTGVRPGGSYVAQVLPGGVLSAIGLGLALVPATIAAVSGVPGSQSGLASGLLNTSRLIGGALGLAVLSTVAASQTHAQLEAGASAASALSGGFQVAFGAGAAVSLLGGLLALVLLRPRPAAADAVALSVVPEPRLATAARVAPGALAATEPHFAGVGRRETMRPVPTARRAITRTRAGARALARR